jgi:glutathione reductase (NADPH)
MTQYDFDLFTIGLGSGGTRAARIAAGHGARVAGAEEFRIGGTCVIRGCVPKKLLVYASRFAGEFEDAQGFGWSVKGATFDWSTLIQNKDREIERLSQAYRRGLANAGVTMFDERAEIAGPHSVRLMRSGKTLSAKTILIATGGKPWWPTDLPGIEHAITSNEVFDLPELPRHAIVAGGGYIAVEFACILKGLGADVTLVYRGEQILRGFDRDVRAHLRREMEALGVRFHMNAIFVGIENLGGEKVVHLSNGQILRGDCVLLAIGRTADTESLGLESAGVHTFGEGAIKVDHFSQTSVPSIYAVGDVTNRINLTPVAIREGHVFADSVFGGKPQSCDHHDVPTGVFTTPEIGTVGMTEEIARKGHRVDIYRSVFRPMKHTLTGRQTQTLMKLIVCQETDRVLGCHIVGHDAAEMIQCIAIAVKMKATKADFDATMALHPSAAEELVTMRTKTG